MVFEIVMLDFLGIFLAFIIGVLVGIFMLSLAIMAGSKDKDDECNKRQKENERDDI